MITIVNHYLHTHTCLNRGVLAIAYSSPWTPCAPLTQGGKVQILVQLTTHTGIRIAVCCNQVSGS